MPKNYNCEDCHDTGWYGDNGPGINGNREYVPCDCVERRSRMPICLWTNVGECYETTCKNSFQFTTDGIQKNGFVFCPYCGWRIEEAQDERP